MKKRNWSAYILAAVLIGYGISAIADDGKAQLCETLSSFSGTVMEKRQSGVPESEAMALLNNPKYDPVRSVVRTIIFTAYDKPRYYTEQERADAPDEFANEMYNECVRAFSG